MYAIIKQGNGKAYTSMVFGHYEDKKKEEGTNWWGQYFVVLNENKTALIKHYSFDYSRRPYLHKMIVFTDGNQEDWNIDDETGFGELKITDKQSLLDMVRDGTVSAELLKLDDAYSFDEYPEIKTNTDIENLMWASGGFHDAYIKDLKENNGSLYVLFDGIWGCNIEMWFTGDVSYDTSSLNSEDVFPAWYGSTMILKDGFIYFVDEEGMKVEDIGEGFCWFKARNIKYHIITDPA